MPFAKVCLLGDSGVGKSSLVYRMQHDDLIGFGHTTTIGTAFVSINLVLNNNTTITCHLWDTAGQERFNSVVPLYFRGTKVYMLMFDLNNRDSWVNIENIWLPMVVKHTTSDVSTESHIPVVIIVGNKKDTKHMVTKEEIGILCEKHKLHYIEISAKIQPTKEIIDECVVKSINYYMKKNPGFANDTEYYSEEPIIRLQRKQPRQCSNKALCII